MNKAEDVIAIALAEEGYLEKSKTAYRKNNKILDFKEDGAGSDNYTKYGRDMHEIYPETMDFPGPWCDCFVDWCFYKAYGTSNAMELLAGNFDDYTVRSAQLYMEKDAWYTSDPKPGDQIFFKRKTEDTICHTGLVYKIYDGYVYTIEGNTSSALGMVANGGCVQRKSYALTYQCIAGYGRPNYDIDPMSKETAEAIKEAEWSLLIMDLQKALNAEYGANLPVNGIVNHELLDATPTLNARIRTTRPHSVKALQALLSHWEYKCFVDGDFYSATEKMVKAFQKEKVGLSRPDGEFTARKNSWKVLLKLLQR